MQGILFKEDMFLAAVAGIKTVTRRIGSLLEPNVNQMVQTHLEWHKGKVIADGFTHEKSGAVLEVKPRYKAGEVVYLKEPFWRDELFDEIVGNIYYKYGSKESDFKNFPPFSWENKLFMKQKYARYFIKVKKVQCERIKDITEMQAESEGIKHCNMHGLYWDYIIEQYCLESAAKSFLTLFQKIAGNKFERFQKTNVFYRFDLSREKDLMYIEKTGNVYITIANPYVFAYTFELCD